MKYLKKYNQFETQITPDNDDLLQNYISKKTTDLNRDLTKEEYDEIVKYINKNNIEEIPEINYAGKTTKNISKNPIGSTVSSAG
jgi:N-acetyl-beta-hexosaminidase